jgi:PDZ domain
MFASRLRRPLTLLTGAALLCTTSLAGQGTYADPQGRFVVAIPSGWTIAPLGPDAITLSGQSASVTVVTDETTGRDPLLDQQLGRYRILWAGFTEVGRGPLALAGRDGVFILSSGTDPRGIASFLKLVGVSRGPGSLVLLETAPQASYPSLRRILEQVELGLRLGEAAPPTAQMTPPAPGVRAFLGIATRPMQPEDVAQLGLDSARGALVSDVAPGGPAEGAGIAAGDVVLAADGATLSGAPQLVQIVLAHHPGDILVLQIVRQGRPLVISVRLGTAPPR